ncbi:MAG: hypothetical protein ACK4RS_04825, partial [Thiothrix sp.]
MSFSQRPHKFVTWFQKRTGGDVLWIDPYPSRLPRWGDWSRLVKSKPSRAAEQMDYPAWLTVIRPPALPLEPLRTLNWLNRGIWFPLLKQLRTFADNDTTLLAIGKPSALALTVMHTLPQSRSLYDVMDNCPAFYTGLTQATMRIYETQLIRQADTVWASSTPLQQQWQTLRPDI